MFYFRGKYLLLSIMVFCNVFLYGQYENKIQRNNRCRIDSSAWEIPLNIIEKRLKLCDINQVKDSLFFRYFSHNLIIDIWTNDFIKFDGKYTYYAEKQNKSLIRVVFPRYNRNRHFKYEIVKMDSNLSLQIYLLYKSIDAIPSWEQTKGWGFVCDGSNYAICFSKKGFVGTKTYNSPCSFDNLAEEKKICNFVDSITMNQFLNDEYTRFWKSLPSGRYLGEAYFFDVKLSKRLERKLLRQHMPIK